MTFQVEDNLGGTFQAIGDPCNSLAEAEERVQRLRYWSMDEMKFRIVPTE